MLATVSSSPVGITHGYGYLWNTPLIWLHVASDVLITASYFTVPITLVYLIRKRRDVPFFRVLVCLGVFALAAGTTHLLAVYSLWQPAWWMWGGAKAVTALASLPTAVLLYRVAPDVLSLPGSWMNAALQEAHDALGRRVAEGNAELATAHEALERSHERYRALVEATAQIVWRADVDGVFGLEQPGWSHLTGQTAEQLENPGAIGAVHPDDRARMEAIWRHAIATGLQFETVCRLRRRDGEFRHMAVRAVPVCDASGGVLEWVGTHTDITEQEETEERLRRAESQLLQAQRMEAVGRLAGGVAHDFSNILTVIASSCQALLETLPETSDVRADAVDIEHATSRATYLTRQLLTFSRRQGLQLQLVSLNTIILVVEAILRRVLGQDIELHAHLAADLGAVRADPGQIEQVLMNLAVNSRDAMPAGGDLTIETANVELGPDLGVEPGPYVALIVSDTGQGMDTMTRAQIFEPFFSTKGPGRGAGLGLSTVYGIVKQCDGTIWVYSDPGRGTTFKIFLPRAGEAAEVTSTGPAIPETWADEGGEVILLAEDEISVRVHSANVLRQAGYTVLDAPDGAAALAIAQNWTGPLHLVITDMIMPGLGGRALAEHVVERYPSIAVLFMSGYMDEEVVRSTGAGVPAFLQKPYTPSSFLRKVREVLEAARAVHA